MSYDLFHLENEMQTRVREVEATARTAWMEKARPERKARLSLFRRTGERELLCSRAMEVLRDMLEHENTEIRLKAAEIVMRHATKAKG